MNLSRDLESIGKIGETRTLKVAARGAGLYLYLPKDLREVYGVMAGDRIEVKLGRIYRPREYVGGEGER